MNPQSNKVNRRTFLKGVGVTMALPWLESIPVWGSEAAGAKPPRRFAALFMGNGISPNHWWAKGAGSDMELSKSLEPLSPFRSRLNVISGLFNKHATGVGIHPGQTGNILSGAALQKGAVLRGGVSMDQVLAARLGEETAQPSLVLGCEQPITGYHETNFSMAYSSHISWQDANSPVPMEVYPSLAFDSLFDNQGSRRTLGILDRVREQTAALNGRVSHSDRAKLDEYLTSVRDVEKRVQRTRAAKDQADDKARGRGRPAASMPRPDNGLPEDIREHMRLMCDIVALAFQTTANALQLLENPRSCAKYRMFLPARFRLTFNDPLLGSPRNKDKANRFRKAVFSAAVRSYKRRASSRNTTSNTQCRPFSMLQWPRMAFPIRRAFGRRLLIK